jgi:choline dehydrogenase-like flavoprotein
MNFVIGSGPAGVACAKALLDQGQSVCMLDAGLELEPERAQAVQHFSHRPREDWSKRDLDDYQSGMIPDVGGVPLKLVYGSDFAYREANERLRVQYDNVGLRPSLAKGGLSNVWGAAMMPFQPRDLRDWPLPVKALAQHYSAVLPLTGLAANRDALEKNFPLYTENFTSLRPSNQAARLLDKMAQNRKALEDAGIHFGQSRLAVQGNRPGEDSGCCYCRLCMYGCPYGYIYTSAFTVDQLQTHPNFHYQSGVIVNNVRESSSGVEIFGADMLTGKPQTWRASRVFVAGGTIPTTRILLRSLEAYDQTVWLKDSQYFLLPLLLLKRVRSATHESLHALSQIFLELFSADGAENGTHIQIYSNNDLISQAVAQAFGPLKQPLGFLLRNLQDRMLVAQGFLHSDHSSRVAIRLKKNPGDGSDQLELKAELNPAARARVRGVVWKLLRQTRNLGAVALPMMLKFAEPGRSFHCGGTFPMNEQPKGFQTDLLGRLPGWKRVHAVDATVFPSIPATTITLSVMANAHRIGWEAAKLD